MFNTEDKETLMKLIDSRSTTDSFIPLYIIIGNKKYLLVDMDEIEECSPSIFKIGFGFSDSVFIRNKFPKDKLINFSNSRIFSKYDDDKLCYVQYYVFESSNIEYDEIDDIDKIINKWYDCILEHVMNHVDIIKKERIKQSLEDMT